LDYIEAIILKMKKNKTEIIILGLIVIVGFGLRLIGIDKHLLWHDEAETVINAQQILDVGYPNGEYKGQPIFENGSYIPSASEKYEYESTNYFGSKYERNKGWLTYYFLAGFLKIFGFSNYSVRLPFVLLSLLTVILIFFLGQAAFSVQVGLLAASIHAFNFWAIFYEQQTRYYALFILLSLLVFYFYHRLQNQRKLLNYFYLTVFLVLLFHTHIVAAACALVFVIYNELVAFRFNIVKFYASWKYWLLFYLLCTLSWWLLVNGFLGVFLPKNGGDFYLWWLFILASFCLAYYVFRLFVKQFYKKKFIQNQTIGLLVNYLVIYVIVAPWLIPGESLVARMFLPLFPILALMIAYLIYQFATLFLEKLYLKATVRIFLCFMIFILLQIFFYNSHYQNHMTEVDWIGNIMQVIESQGADDQTLILVDSNEPSYLLYYNYRTDLVWPLRKSYIDDWPGRMYLIFNYDMDWCSASYFEDWQQLYCLPDRRNYSEKIKSCAKELFTFADKRILLYSCLAKN